MRRPVSSSARTEQPDVAAWFRGTDFGGLDSTKFSASVPLGWSTHTDSPWTHLAEPGATIPEQGWKVHVSATEATAHQTLSVVSDVAVVVGVPFKHLESVAAFRAANSKYADRAAAGKFVALYPSGADELQTVLEALDRRLAGFPGPYILSDARYGDGPVFVRYGAFRELRATIDGREVLCLRGPSGDLIEDVREPVFVVPAFVDVPRVISAAVEDRLNPPDDGLDTLLPGKTVERAMHFTNGGGVYLVLDGSGERVVMKEGRPHAGRDPRGVDAFVRTRNEHATLVALADTGVTPRPSGFRTAGGHGFLFEEFVDGDSLHTWVAKNYPFSFVLPVEPYEAQASQVLRSLMTAVAAVHARGFAVMDLQPSNVIVADDLSVRLIDLESSCHIDADRADTYIGTPGFVPTVPHTPLQRDRYALLQLALNLFFPLTSLAAVSDTVIDSLAERIRERFSSSVTSMIDELRVRGEVVRHASGLESCEELPGAANETARLLESGLRRVRNASESTTYPMGDRGPLGAATADAVTIESGLAGVMIGLGAHDVHAAADRADLIAKLDRVASPRRGLFTGVTGAAVLVGCRGEPRVARETIARARAASNRNVSIRSGAAGELIAAVLLDRQSGGESDDCDEDVASALTSVRDRLRRVDGGIVSPGAGTGRPLGLLDGWSGVGYSLVVAADHLDDPSLFAEAREALDRDLVNLVRAPDGSLQADDGDRMMPYLADGSAGIGLALSAVPNEYRRDGDDQILESIATACRARVCVSAGLFHGRAGLVLALAAMDVDHVHGIPVSDVVREQLDLLAPHLFRAAQGDGLFVPTDDNRMLGTGFAEGAAGVAYALRLLSGEEALPGPASLSERISGRLRQTDHPDSPPHPGKVHRNATGRR